MNSATGSSSPSLLIESVIISSFSTNGRNNWTNSALYGGEIVSKTSLTKYLKQKCHQIDKDWLNLGLYVLDANKLRRFLYSYLINEISVSVFSQQDFMYLTTGMTYPRESKFTSLSSNIFLISSCAKISNES